MKQWVVAPTAASVSSMVDTGRHTGRNLTPGVITPPFTDGFSYARNKESELTSAWTTARHLGCFAVRAAADRAHGATTVAG